MKDNKLNWRLLYFGHMPIKEVLEAVQDKEWQIIRLSMKGKSLESKYNTLHRWLNTCQRSRASQVQVTNYVTALSRGGLIKPSDYREATKNEKVKAHS